MKPLLCLVFLGSIAAAQPTPKVTQAKTEKPTVINYDDPDVLEVTLARPDDFWITARNGVKHKSLIKIRGNFLAEMFKSAEDR